MWKSEAVSILFMKLIIQTRVLVTIQRTDNHRLHFMRHKVVRKHNLYARKARNQQTFNTYTSELPRENTLNTAKNSVIIL